jgi:hypothetical protein
MKAKNCIVAFIPLIKFSIVVGEEMRISDAPVLGV